MQSQIDSITAEYSKGREELEVARAEADCAQQKHRLLLDSENNSEEDDPVDHDMGTDLDGVEEFASDPAVQAGKRSLLHALAEARKRKVHKETAPDDVHGDDRGPVLGEEPAEGEGSGQASAAAADLSAATPALASSVDADQSSAALDAIRKVANELGASAKAKPGPKIPAARPGPYAKSG